MKERRREVLTSLPLPATTLKPSPHPPYPFRSKQRIASPIPWCTRCQLFLRYYDEWIKQISLQRDIADGPQKLKFTIRKIVSLPSLHYTCWCILLIAKLLFISCFSFFFLSFFMCFSSHVFAHHFSTEPYRSESLNNLYEKPDVSLDRRQRTCNQVSFNLHTQLATAGRVVFHFGKMSFFFFNF